MPDMDTQLQRRHSDLLKKKVDWSQRFSLQSIHSLQEKNVLTCLLEWRELCDLGGGFFPLPAVHAEKVVSAVTKCSKSKGPVWYLNEGIWGVMNQLVGLWAYSILTYLCLCLFLLPGLGQYARSWATFGWSDTLCMWIKLRDGKGGVTNETSHIAVCHCAHDQNPFD